jgi:hypothetical protein
LKVIISSIFVLLQFNLTFCKHCCVGTKWVWHESLMF